jgi:hypothetical protein
MTLELSGSTLKLVQALLHLKELGDAFEAMAAEAAGQLTLADEEIQRHPLGWRHLFRIGTLVQPPVMVGPILGDYVQNLRAALDHLAWEMVQKGAAVNYNPNLVQFPIYSVGRSANRRRRTFTSEIGKNLPGISRYQQAFVRKYQPYHRGNWHLAALAEFSNRDKHRLLTPVHLFGTNVRRRHLRATKGRIVSWKVLLREGRPVNERTPFLEVIVSERDAEVEMYARLTTPVTFEERPRRYHRMPAFRGIGEKVAQIVEEAATRWGNPTDAAVARRWPRTAHRVMGLDT